MDSEYGDFRSGAVRRFPISALVAFHRFREGFQQGELEAYLKWGSRQGSYSEETYTQLLPVTYDSAKPHAEPSKTTEKLRCKTESGYICSPILFLPVTGDVLRGASEDVE